MSALPRTSYPDGVAFPRRGKLDPATTAAWKARQAELRQGVIVTPLRPVLRFVAGVDCAFDGEEALAVAVVWDREAGEVVDRAAVRRPVGGPYVPGFLSFREGPAVHAALDGLTREHGLILFDGQGLAHPRRCGLATHVGVERDVPSVGVAKSRLIGTHAEVGPETGDAADLMDRGERVGVVLRTRVKTRPLFVSVGHRCDLASAVGAVLACRTRYRLPEPTRLADRAVAADKALGRNCLQ